MQIEFSLREVAVFFDASGGRILLHSQSTTILCLNIEPFVLYKQAHPLQ